MNLLPTRRFMLHRGGSFDAMKIRLLAALLTAGIASGCARPPVLTGADAGRADAGGSASDAGPFDAGGSVSDAGSFDAGGVPDAGVSVDGGESVDAGTQEDAGVPADAGTNGADAGCAAGSTAACTSSCGTSGASVCAGGAWGACEPPSEACDLEDDDCDGACDDLMGCRVGVDRSDNATAGLHFYTTDDAEAGCCGYSVEGYDYFYLYASQEPGLVPFYRCRSSTGAHRYTTDPSCGGDISEGVLGFIATQAVCGAIPLYELRNPSNGDDFFTTSSAEQAAAQAEGLTPAGTAGYVWPDACAGPGCTWKSPVAMSGEARTSVTGFPTAWYGFPISGTQSFTSLSGTVSITQSDDLYSEVLFILQYLPTGACPSGRWPATTPEFGPPGARGIGQVIVKAPTHGSFTLPIDFELPGGLPISNCLLLGLNGGPVSTGHDMVSSANLSLGFTAPQTPPQQVIGMGGEFCYGQDWGCQKATTVDTQSFAAVTKLSQPVRLVALYGDISDTTFDGTSAFGPPPAGSWTATNDFYVYHGAECDQLGSGILGPGNYYANIPPDATLLLSVPLSGRGIGVATQPVDKTFPNLSIPAGDCLVTLWGLQGTGGFDNETQVTALVTP